MPTKINLIDQRFGRLRVIAEAAASRDGRTCWRCACDCGNVIVTSGKALRSAHTRSCGCISRDNMRNVGKMARHGQATKGKRSPEYFSWCAMIQRCYNSRHRFFADYGGRGITVCDRWNVKVGGSFANFLADMGERPREQLPSGKLVYSLDRINNDLHYEPGNCRWSTQREQIANRRRRATSK